MQMISFFGRLVSLSQLAAACISKSSTPPLDYGWMSTAVYERLDDPNIANQVYAHQNLLDVDWELRHFIPSDTTNGQYQGAVYVHSERCEVVVAHAGTSFKKWGTLEADWMSVVHQKIHPQVTEALERTITEDIQVLLLEENYKLAFTGHSLGGFLATLSLYLCQRNDLGYYFPNSHAVVFDPAGSLDFMEALEPHSQAGQGLGSTGIDNLNIQHYVSYPNYVNAFRPHAGGTKYSLTAPTIKKAIKDMKNQPLQYLLATHSLSDILSAFDENTGYPFPEYCRIATDWPLIQLNDLERLGTIPGFLGNIISMLDSFRISLTNWVSPAQEQSLIEWKKWLGGEEFQSAALSAMELTQDKNLKTKLQSRYIFLDADYRYTLRLCHFNETVQVFLKDLILFSDLSLVGDFFDVHGLSRGERKKLSAISLVGDRLIMKPEALLTVFDFVSFLNGLVATKGMAILQLRAFLVKQADNLHPIIKKHSENHLMSDSRIVALEEWVRNYKNMPEIGILPTVSFFSAMTHKKNAPAEVAVRMGAKSYSTTLNQFGDSCSSQANCHFGSAISDAEGSGAKVDFVVTDEAALMSEGETSSKKMVGGR